MIAQITPEQLSERLTAGLPTLLVDVREVWENEICRLPDSQLVPMSEFAERALEIEPEPGQLVVCYCHHGIRSRHAAAYLQMHGISDVVSLLGGVALWADTVEPAMARY